MTVLRISESRASPWATKSVLLRCPACNTDCEVLYPWNATREQKIRLRHDVIDHHRRVCVGGPAEVERVYEVEFPRL